MRKIKKTDRELKQKLTASLEDQFYPAQKAVATQLANAVERAGLLTHGALSDITRPVFVPALAAEFTKEGAEELTQILRCAYREMPKNPAAKPNEVASGAQVLVSVAKQGKSKVQGEATKIGSKPQGPTPQLSLMLGGIRPKPKPRKGGIVDQEQWAVSLDKATTEVNDDFDIPGGIQQYYDSMCEVGQKMVVSTIIKKAQGIYDYRIGRMMHRGNRKHKAS